MSLFVSWEEVFESAALRMIPTAWGWRSPGCTAGWWCLCEFVRVLEDVTSISLKVRALSFLAVVMAFFRVHSKPKNMPLSLFSMLSISLTAYTASSFRVLSILLRDSRACFTLFKCSHATATNSLPVSSAILDFPVCDLSQDDCLSLFKLPVLLICS